MTCLENREDVVLLLAVFRTLISDCNDISRPKTYPKKKTVSVSVPKDYTRDFWAQFWDEKSADNVPVKTVSQRRFGIFLWYLVEM